MIFQAHIPFPKTQYVYLDAPSWYDAKEYARRWPGAIVRASWVGDVVVSPITVPRVTPTSYEREQDVADSIRAQEHRRCVKALRLAGQTVQAEMLAICAPMGGLARAEE